MSTVSAPTAQTAEAVRLSAADLLATLVDACLNRDKIADDTWTQLAIEADVAAAALRVPPSDCPRCIGRDLKEPDHSGDCPLLTPSAESRDDLVAALELRIEAVPEEFRDAVRSVEIPKIDARFVCTCKTVEPKKRGAADNSFAGRVKQATDRMRTAIVEVAGAPDSLRVEFNSGASKTWDLPTKTDHPAIKAITAGAIEWAKEQGGTDGQVNAVRKALTDKGYYAKAAS